MIGQFNVWALLLQATACMALGLLGSYLWAHKPARAHQILLICMMAGAVLPGLYIGVQHLGLGQLDTKAQVPMVAVKPLEPLELNELVEPLALGISIVDMAPLPEVTPYQDTPLTDLKTVVVPSRPIPWLFIGLALWGLVSLLLLARLLWQFFLGLRLIQDRHVVEDPALKQALLTAKQRLGMHRPVTLCTSGKINSPVIWCWQRVPILLIQDAAAQTHPSCDWAGVFCHELAHAKRLDHISNLWVDLMCIALPWHPLVWWARQRLMHLSEDICDDWALTQALNQTMASTNYAKSLVALTSQKPLAMMPGIIGKERSMKARISRIIQGQFSNPKPGTFWTCLIMTLALCATVGMALAQPKPEEALRAMAEAPHEPMQRGAIERQEAMEIAKIGRLNVLTRLLKQLAEQTEQAERALDQARGDSDRSMRQIELDTLREQMARIEEQIQQTRHPESMREPRRGGIQSATTSTGTRRMTRRSVAEIEPRTGERRELEERRRQLIEELRTVEQELQLSVKTNRIPAAEMNTRLRELKNELRIINAQLENQQVTPEPQLPIYRLEHSNARQMADTQVKVIRQANITPDDNTNSLIVNAAPDEHKQIQQLPRQLDVPRKESFARGASSRSGGASSQASTSSVSTSRLVQSSRSTAQAGRSAEQDLSTEMDELRGQVKGLNNQMQEIRAMLEKLMQQRQENQPTRPEYRR